MLNRATDLKCLEELVEARAGASKQNWTPLIFAVVSGPNGHPEIVQQLLKAGCRVNETDLTGRTALSYASEYGQDDTIEMLLKNGADPNIASTDTKKTPMHIAIENGQFNSV